MIHKMVRLGLLALMVAVGSVACSADAESYERLPDLVGAVDAATECESTTPGPEAELVAESASCEGSGVTLYLFDNERKLDDWRKVAGRLGPVVVGPNWAATGDAEQLRPIAEELGGEMLEPND